MADDLYRIVYCSRNLIDEHSTGTTHDTELERILNASRTNNQSVDVTGALLFNREFFAQVLEGPRASVEKTFERIQRARRHGEVTVVENGFAGARDFPAWAMAHAAPTSSQVEEGICATLQMALLQPSANGEDVLMLMKDLVIQD